MKRTITEIQLRNIIRETLRLLTEADSRLKQVDVIIDREFKGLLDPDMRVTSSEYYVNHNENTTWRDYLMYSLRHTFSLMRNSDVKYLPFVAKITFSDEVGFEKRNDNATEINNLREVVELMKQDPTVFEKAKTTCNTYTDVMKLCKPYIEAKKNEMNATVDTTDYGGDKGYEIIEVPNFETANYYGDLSCPTSKLCYTQGENTWNSYTSNGANKVYVCLKQGWKNMKPIPGADAPYDDYGTSMIFVFINPDGEIAYANTRWNHENAGSTNVDHAFDKNSLSKVLGMNVNRVIKPFTHEELRKKGIILFEDVPEMLAQGVDPEEIFDGVGSFCEGFAGVYLNGKFNYINKEWKLVSNQWFDGAWAFQEGLAKVCLNGKWNFINQEGKFLSNQWFDYVGGFSEGFAKVYLNGKWNFINKECKLLSNQWFNMVDGFSEGFARVRLNGNEYIVDTEGNLYNDDGQKITTPINEGFIRKVVRPVVR